ncbi:hypothetical protein D9M71_784590 [compost metagenome]
MAARAKEFLANGRPFWLPLAKLFSLFSSLWFSAMRRCIWAAWGPKPMLLCIAAHALLASTKMSLNPRITGFWLARTFASAMTVSSDAARVMTVAASWFRP